ncbi:MAG: helix-turn-helix domain-containing protein [Candidatus Sedimenticola sp. 6PFRAG7]
MTQKKKSDYEVILEGANSDAFSERIKELIGDFNSAANLARACGFSEAVVRKWRDGKSEPSREKLVAIALNTGVTLEWLATGYGPKHPQESGEGRLTSAQYDSLLDDIKLVVTELETLLKEQGMEITTPESKAKLVAMTVDYIHTRDKNRSEEPVSAQIIRFIKNVS